MPTVKEGGLGRKKKQTAPGGARKDKSIGAVLKKRIQRGLGTTEPWDQNGLVSLGENSGLLSGLLVARLVLTPPLKWSLMEVTFSSHGERQKAPQRVNGTATKSGKK